MAVVALAALVAACGGAHPPTATPSATPSSVSIDYARERYCVKLALQVAPSDSFRALNIYNTCLARGGAR